MKFKIALIVLAVFLPLVATNLASAEEKVKKGKIEWFLDDINRLNKATDYHSDVASVWPGEKIHEGGYVLPGSKLQLHYRSLFDKHLTLLFYSPKGQIVPLFVNQYHRMIPTKSPILKYDVSIPPVEGRCAAMLIASRGKLERETIEKVAMNPDAEEFPEEVDSVSFCHFYSVDYINPKLKDAPRHEERHGAGAPPGGGSGGYNQPIYNQGYYQGGVNPQMGPYGPQPIPLQKMGPTYYFYPSGWVSRNYYPYPYYYPYYYNRPGYYYNPNQNPYLPQGQRYYIIPQGNGVRTNLYDFIFEANFNYGSILFGDDGFIGGKFFIDGNNPSPNGVTFRFPSKNVWEHEGPDGSWTYYMPDDFEFYLNGQPLQIYGGGQNDPFMYIPLQGFLMNGLNEFRLLPRTNENLYGIGPIEISADIKF